MITPFVELVSAFNPRSGREWTSFDAVAIAEGFEQGTPEEQMEAWAYLIHIGMAWQLQGFFGRGASRMIEANYISQEGEINWGYLDDKFDFSE